MNGDFWDKFQGESSTDEELEDTQDKKNRRLPVLAPLAVVLACTLVAGTFGLFPWQYKEDAEPPQNEDPAPAITQVKGTNTPARTALDAIFKEKFSNVAGLSPTDTREEGIARTLPGQQGCEGVIAPSASTVQGYAGGKNWRSPKVITVTANAYPAGLGAEAQSRLTEDCEGVTDVSEDEGIISGSIQGSRFIAWRTGDVVYSITGTNVSIPEGLKGEVNDRAMKSLKPVCANLKSGDESARNPYYSRDDYTGLLESQEVPALDEDVVEEMTQPDIEPLPDVTRPSPPDEPYYPYSLPDVVDKPDVPQVPKYPATSKSIHYQVEDSTGPGCGWDFTSMIAPNFDPKTAEDQRVKRVEKAEEDMGQDFEDYSLEVNDWTSDWVIFEREASDYRTYAEEVEETSDQWQEQKDAQEIYADELDKYDEAVEERDTFTEDQEDAQEQYDQDVETCEAWDEEQEEREAEASEQPSPSPSDGGGASDNGGEESSPPSPAPTRPAECPAQRPDILDDPTPSVPDQPTPPTDPRPEGDQ